MRGGGAETGPGKGVGEGAAVPKAAGPIPILKEGFIGFTGFPEFTGFIGFIGFMGFIGFRELAT